MTFANISGPDEAPKWIVLILNSYENLKENGTVAPMIQNASLSDMGLILWPLAANFVDKGICHVLSFEINSS